jgi:NADH oxidase (H2O2-forming)
MEDQKFFNVADKKVTILWVDRKKGSKKLIGEFDPDVIVEEINPNQDYEPLIAGRYVNQISVPQEILAVHQSEIADLKTQITEVKTALRDERDSLRRKLLETKERELDQKYLEELELEEKTATKWLARGLVDVIEGNQSYKGVNVETRVLYFGKRHRKNAIIRELTTNLGYTIDTFNLVIVGGNAAGVSAAQFARKIYRKANIIVIEREPYSQYSRCGLPYSLSKVIPEFDDLQEFKEGFYKVNNIDIRLQQEVIDIDPVKKSVQIRVLETGKVYELPYDKLILATGATPWIPPIENKDKYIDRGVFFLRTMDQGIAIQQFIEGKEGKMNAVVVGAGLVGLETAEALSEMGLEVSVIEALDHPLGLFMDADVAKLATKVLTNHGIKLYLGHFAKGFIGDEEQLTGVEIKSRNSDETIVIPTEICVVGTGNRPNLELAEKAGCDIGRQITINERCETSVSDIYAIGDCTEWNRLFPNKIVPVGMGTMAVRMGRVAGENSVGGGRNLAPLIFSRVTKLFDTWFAAVGPTVSELERDGWTDYVATRYKGSSRPHYFPGHQDLITKLIAEKSSGKIIGAQLVGKERVAQRANVIAMAIQMGATVDDLIHLENVYSPPTAPVWDPIVEAAFLLEAKIKRDLESAKLSKIMAQAINFSKREKFAPSVT